VNGLGFALDVLVAVSIPAIGLAAAVRRDLVGSVMLLFAAGLVLTVAWARLGAPDVAMVEAALGSGLTGVLFLSALGRTGVPAARRRPPLRWLAAAGLCTAAVVPVGIALSALPREARGLLDAVARETPNSGATHMVTSVLLNFRGYDTLLEIAVLLLAVLGAWAASGAEVGPAGKSPRPGPLLTAAVRLLLPLVVVVSGVLLWVGSRAPGGAFQAGTVLGTALVLLSLSGAARGPRVPDWALRAVLALGFAVFLAVAGGAMAAGGALLEYPRLHAAGLLLAIEATLTLSIAFVMAALVEGRSPDGRGRGAA
jgi:multisubunit Na+/H+ antiporter MnhB subunit